MEALCAHKNIFGKPGQGVHSYRIFNIAIVDTLLTLVAAYLIGRYYKMKPLDIFYVFAVLMILSVLVHKLFCVETTLTKLF